MTIKFLIVIFILLVLGGALKSLEFKGGFGIKNLLLGIIYIGSIVGIGVPIGLLIFHFIQ